MNISKFITLTKDAALSIASVALEHAKSATLPVKLTNDMLNKATGAMFSEDGEIRSVTVTVHDGWFQATAKIRHGVATFDVSVDFEVLRFEINRHVHVVELRQKNDLKTDCQGWGNKIAMCVIRAIILAFTGKSLLHWVLEGKDGITVSGDLISIDLAKAGAKEAIYTAMADKIGQSGSFLSGLVQGGAEKVADHVAISGARCTDGALEVNIAPLVS